MLQKVILIKNIGRFRHSAASGDVTFRRYTLICAENGRGKTTLCAILRSLLANSPAIICTPTVILAVLWPQNAGVIRLLVT